VIGKPAVHVRDALDGEPALVERPFQLGQAGVAAGLQGGRLLPDASVVGGPVTQDAANPREAELYRASGTTTALVSARFLVRTSRAVRPLTVTSLVLGG
jgi:hypothetical protein